MTVSVHLRDLALARSGDKGAHANIGVIAKDPLIYPILLEQLSTERVLEYFSHLHPKQVQRYPLPNLHAINFVLQGILEGGGNRSLRVDAQGKAFGQALLAILIKLPEDLWKELKEKEHVISSH